MVSYNRNILYKIKSIRMHLGKKEIKSIRYFIVEKIIIPGNYLD